MTDYPYPAEDPDELGEWEWRDADISCPLCDSQGVTWEYGVECENEACPAKEIGYGGGELDLREMTVAVDANTFREFLLDHPDAAESIANQTDIDC